MADEDQEAKGKTYEGALESATEDEQVRPIPEVQRRIATEQTGLQTPASQNKLGDNVNGNIWRCDSRDQAVRILLHFLSSFFFCFGSVFSHSETPLSARKRGDSHN